MSQFTKPALISMLAAYCFAVVIGVSAAPGDLDPTFGNGGVLIKRVMDIDHYSMPSSILVQPDGKILVSGQIDEYGELVGFFIARFNSDGSPDLSFGYEGMILPTIEYGGVGVGADIALQPDGRIVAVGKHGFEIAVQRFDSTGELDPSFGEGGKVVFTPPGKDGGEATSVAIQNDGKIVVVGNAWTSGGNQMLGLMARLNSDGSLDDSFGTAGAAFTFLCNSTRFDRLYIQPNGKVLVIGECRPTPNAAVDIIMLRVNADGSTDGSFGSGGSVIASHGDVDFFSGAGLQPDGKILTAGWGYISASGVNYKFLTRYNSDGSVDTGFSANVIPSSQFRINNLTFQADGKIVAFGSVAAAGDQNFTDMAIVRLNPNGTFDTDFGTNGTAVIQMGTTSYYYAALRGEILPNGKLLVLGNRGNYNTYEFALARFQGYRTFSVSGRVTTWTGLGLRNAAVTLTDTAGNKRAVVTSSLGFYSFDDIPAGQIVTIAVSSRRYRFEPITRTMNESLSDVDLVALE